MRGKGLGQVRGRVAVVTGAASGIGRATAVLLAVRGARMAIGDRDAGGLRRTADEIRARGGAVCEVPVDVTRPDEIERFRARTVEELGVPELVVNAAGIVVVGGFLETPPEEWDLVLAVNLRGPALVTRAFAPAMIERGRGGCIVNVASAASFFTPEKLSAYGATKHGLVGLSQALREELAPHRIGVTLVCPGFVDTPIVENARLFGEPEPEAFRRRMRALVRRRGLRPEHVAAAIVRAVERGSELVPVGVEAWVLHGLVRASPKAAARLIGAVARNGDHLLRFAGRFQW